MENQKHYWKGILYGFLGEDNHHLCIQYKGLFEDQLDPKSEREEAQKMVDEFPAIVEVICMTCEPGLKQAFDESKNSMADRLNFYLDAKSEGRDVRINRY